MGQSIPGLMPAHFPADLGHSLLSVMLNETLQGQKKDYLESPPEPPEEPGWVIRKTSLLARCPNSLCNSIRRLLKATLIKMRIDLSRLTRCVVEQTLNGIQTFTR